jgi:hypothetical protein
VQHFANLEELEISHISPHLIINLDETDFGASKSRSQKYRKVVVPQSLSQKPVFKETSDSHFIIVLCAISASGNVLRSGLIVERQTGHPDADQSSFLRNVQRYVSPNAFVTRQIFNDYLRNVLSPYIAHWRESVGTNVRTILIFDGHRAHLSDVLNAWAAAYRILLCLLPPQSLHLLQRLDQGFFRRLKIRYSLFAPKKSFQNFRFIGKDLDGRRDYNNCMPHMECLDAYWHLLHDSRRRMSRMCTGCMTCVG